MAILVGGEGRRLGGVTKPLLLHPSGQRLIDEIIATFESATSELLILSTERTALALGDAGFGDRLVMDAGTGPAGALAAAARATCCPWLVLAAGDLVRPSRALLDRLLALREPAKAALVSQGGFLQPQLSVWPAAEVRSIDIPEGRSLRSVAEQLAYVALSADKLASSELAGLDGVNDPSDLLRFSIARPTGRNQIGTTHHPPRRS
ncbi:MAG: NTP transferase domain-containing protein [Deltaproteobacteria bacterium]|nr:NTP transferase domain-containing protein [Deltaproteobacteria bacterium]